MRKIIAGINMTIDGFCDHTGMLPDAEIHEHFADMLRNADIILYGRITYQLMEYWRDLAQNPSGEKSMDDFAVAMDNIPKIVFSNTLNKLDWHSADLTNKTIEHLVSELKSQSGKDILVGSRSLIIQLIKLNLIDELQLCVHPVIAGGGLPLFENLNDRSTFKLLGTKTFSSGAVNLCYEPKNNS
ncbi:MAG: dihydrofolate reductase family protein [Saprospiraceae bacterium]|nr:dihydrofolate reductase family protein [Candidatus Brachybacter algidus]